MARMVRKQVYIEVEQQKRLKALAKERGVSEAELIRQGVDLALARGETPILDHQAWEEELAFMRERDKLPSSGGQRTWTRDELYDDRLSRRH